MDLKEKTKIQAERTVEHLLKKIEKTMNSLDDGGRHLTNDEVMCLEKAWKTICSIKTMVVM